MNCKQFNSIPLEEVLASLGHLPTKQNEKEAWYLNPFASESHASFKLNKSLNLWFLFSEGIGGNNTDFIQKYFSYSVKEVLNWASEHNFSSFHKQEQKQTLFDKAKNIKPDYQIDEIKELQNHRLKNYLQQRGLLSDIYPYVKEITLTVNNKRLYAVGFKNQSGGFELRNSFYKGAILKKDISVIQLGMKNDLSGSNNGHTNNIQPDISTNTKDNSTDRNISVFEGFMDALSFIELHKTFIGDLLILNSTSLLKKSIEHLKNYSEINLFLDNDKAGEKCKMELLESFPHAKDHSGLYAPHKDLNDYLVYMERKVKTTVNTEFSQLESVPQAELSEFIQWQFGNIPESQEQIPNDQKVQEKRQEQPEQENIQTYRRRR
ncbi:toprim domain-containing protein [Elizabethkingia miricola]|uniref:Toprim domain-containing protein n=1 Tax=Elizabethkingia miricola TaxID=172045 RepID=A0ABD5B1W0_ELIMR|nr:toprim domain-containing protein [Elizabethkingia miricola]MDQ8747833.1 toprim domain-containing protein [Elizabethkingia miricola]